VTEKKFWPAMLMLGVLAVVAWNGLTDDRFRVATILILAMFAVKILITHRKQLRAKSLEGMQGLGSKHRE
jgi:hypothetical protein